jgi:hypothetical protein
MRQTSFKFYDINPEQIPLPLDYTKCEYNVTYGHDDIPYGTIMNSIDSAISMGNPVMNSYLNVNNSDGGVMARMDDTGLSIKMENQSWLKTKMANWLGIKYL